MSMRKLAWMLAIVLLIVFFGPFVVGITIQKNYQRMLSAASSQDIKIQVVKYKRSWFYSHALLQVTIDATLSSSFSTSQPLHLVLDQTIYHGPFVFGNAARFHNHFVWALIKNKFYLDRDFKKILKSLSR